MRTVCAVTGASGYVGSKVAARLTEEFDIVTLGRAGQVQWTFGKPIGDALQSQGVKVLVHVAWDSETLAEV